MVSPSSPPGHTAIQLVKAGHQQMQHRIQYRTIAASAHFIAPVEHRRAGISVTAHHTSKTMDVSLDKVVRADEDMATTLSLRQVGRLHLIKYPHRVHRCTPPPSSQGEKTREQPKNLRGMSRLMRITSRIEASVDSKQAQRWYDVKVALGGLEWKEGKKVRRK
ncbi:hypothetical protein BJ508DRAFT_342592 [Ascobolus immersus RN42]|uniref:Uncharacterized protein n=1 Tax=Ascobolus immersus RN42 TaxID=1160509 RepID=A0A3N4IBK6_ASCIM|nr:hypothetical protein BJ508DRAFT_342592 [Ascobolus immersus RN42]